MERDLNKYSISDDEWDIIEKLCHVFKVSFIIVIFYFIFIYIE
jgi:hypothetical protein